jgi:MFS family permease
VLADRFDRRKLLMVTQSTSFFLNFFLAMLVLRQQADMRWILALVAGGGVIYALDLPARQAFLCDLVGPAQVRGAVILNSLGFHLARMTGPVLAGIVIATVNEGWCLLLNAASFLAVSLTLLTIGTRTQQEVEMPRTGMLEGLRYVRGHPELLRILLLLSAVSLLGAQHSTFIPVLIRQNMHGGARILGMLMGAPGIGALVAAAWLLFRSSSERISFLLPMMMAASGFTIAILAWSTHAWLAEILLVFLGFCVTFQSAGSNILLQESAPEWIRGRIMALFSMAFMGLMPVGAFMLGLAARHANVSAVLVGAGLICAISALIVEAGIRTRRIAVAAS